MSILLLLTTAYDLVEVAIRDRARKIILYISRGMFVDHTPAKIYAMEPHIPKITYLGTQDSFATDEEYHEVCHELHSDPRRVSESRR